MDMEFTIPIRLSDLQSKQGLDQYCVTEVYSSRVLPNKLADLKTDLRKFERGTIIVHFDSLYSVLCDKSCRENALHETAWTCVIKGLDSLHFLLQTAVEGGNVRDVTLRNSLSMCLYLATEYIQLMENEANKPTTDQIIAGKKKVRKSKSSDNLSMDWERESSRAIKSITKLMTLPIQRLWDPPMVEQNLVNCIGNCLFKLLQNPAMAKLKDSKEGCFHLLAVLIKRHKYSLTAAIQAMENLKLFDHMGSLMAEAMAVVAREFSFPKTAQDLLREIGSLSTDYLQRDSSAARSYSTFLTELAEMIPDVILPVISVLLPFLENDPPSMRNAMLVVLSKLIMNLLTGDDLDENRKNMREEFLDILCEHVHDVNGFVRSKALQVLLSVVESRTLPVSRHIPVAALAQGRLLDKLAYVRKNAMQLMIVLITHNPYGSTLSDKDLTTALETESAKLAELRQKMASAPLPESAVIAPAENWQAMLPETEKAVQDYLLENPDLQQLIEDQSSSQDESITLDSVREELISLLTQCRPADAVNLLVKSQSCFPGSELQLFGLEYDEESRMEEEERILDSLKSIFLAQKVEEMSISDDDTSVGSQLKEQLSKQEIVVKYLQEMYKFCNLLQNSMPIICKLLNSKTSTDVVESIQFVISFVQFGVTDAIQGLAAMLKLVWVADSNIKSAVVRAFRLLYLYSDDTGESREAGRVVASLIALSKTFTILFGQQTAWEELVAEFVRSDDISSEVLQLLWHTFTMKIPDTSTVDSKVALKLIAMAARAKPAIVSSNLDTLLSEGLSERATEDLLVARDVCTALLSLKKKSPRFSKDHDFVTGFVRLLTDSIGDMRQASWIPLMENAVKFIYNMTDTPDVTCASFVKDVYSRVFSGENVSSLNYTHVTRFVALVGQLALCQIIYLEGDILPDLKQKRQHKNSKDQTVDTTSGGDELGQTSGDDLETEVVLKVIEHELLNENNLLSSFLPLLVHILVNRSKFDDDSLQAATTLALGKYMLISPAVCRENLRLYFTVLEKSECAQVKTNAVVALSDLVFRYPNELEPWTPNLYARLRDECSTVRKGTLMVMTRLILNDMVKVKGQISEIAVCLVDKENAIKEMAAQFFTELATKGSALYNILLDIVSRLSDPEVGVDEEMFRTVCIELFRHITVDRQCESLMDRFLLRFRATTDERQWRDIAFCLSRLTYTEKSIKKLMERFSCFSDKLADENVYDCFMVVIEKATQRLKLKPAAKEVITELAAKVEVAHNRGVEDADALENAADTVVVKKRTSKATARRRTRRTRAGSEDEEGMSDGSTCSRKSTSSNISVSQRPSATRRSTRRAVPMKPLENLLDELEEESDEDSAEHFTKTPAPLKSTAGRKKLMLSSSDEDEVGVEAVLSPVPPRGWSVRSRRK